jgi:hypothetical protein
MPEKKEELRELHQTINNTTIRQTEQKETENVAGK